MTECSNLINKDIIYDNSSNYKNSMVITSIHNINEFTVTDCAKTILKENENITFDHVRYSDVDKILYFFSDESISTRKWKEKINTPCKLITFKDFYEEIKSTLLLPLNENMNEISAYDIIKTIKDKYHLIEEENKRAESKFINIFNKANLEYLDFKFNNNEKKLSIIVRDNELRTINITKENDILNINTNLENDKILNLLKEDNLIDEIYNHYLNFSYVKNESSYGITTNHSNFLYNIDKYGLEIYTEICPFYHTKNFSILFSSISDEIIYDCDKKLKNIIQGSEIPILKSMYIEIEKCPNWMREELYKKRKIELKKEDKKEKSFIKKLLRTIK